MKGTLEIFNVNSVQLKNKVTLKTLKTLKAKDNNKFFENSSTLICLRIFHQSTKDKFDTTF